ncbi:MAG: hypothetical protein ACLP0A_01155 [Verrucomicrobiia bacterium]
MAACKDLFWMAVGRSALLGCAVAPGFDSAGYEHGRREDLIAGYPEFWEKIVALTAEWPRARIACKVPCERVYFGPT